MICVQLLFNSKHYSVQVCLQTRSSIPHDSNVYDVYAIYWEPLAVN